MIEDSTAPAAGFLDLGGPVVIAHRGGESAESSPEAIALTAQSGFVLETDVGVTDDGVAVLLHPRGLARLQTWRRFPFVAASSPAERLDEVLDAYPDLNILVDVKQWPAVAPTAIAIARAGAVRRVSIGTFSQARTDATAQAIFDLTGERAWTALGPLASARLILGLTHRGRAPGPQSAQLPYRVITRGVVDRAHGAGIRVIAWTVNTERDMHRLLDMGVDGLITDRPSRLAAVLRQRSER